MDNTKYEIPEDLKAAWDVLPQNCWERQLIERMAELLSENKRLVEELADERLAFEHANEACGKYEADVARLGAPLSQQEKQSNFFKIVDHGDHVNVTSEVRFEAILAARQSAKEPPSPPSTKERQ